MKLLIDFLPIIIFFAVYKGTGDIITATLVLIPATILQVVYTWLKQGRIEKMHIFTLVTVILLGGATVLLKDSTFIKWKPTVVNWLFAIGFLGSHFIGNKVLVQRMLDKSLELPQQAWLNLNYAWVVFFTAMGGVNLYVAYNFSESTWVDFKLFGMLGLTLVFLVLQGLYLAKYLPNEDSQGD